jgi:GT2 family glycosyltransferase
MNEPFQGISIVIPVAPGDGSWTGLAADLTALRIGSEIVLAGPKPPPHALLPRPQTREQEFRRVSWVRTGSGRARQMNQAARHVRSNYIWFLHADSRISARCAHHLALAVEKHPADLIFFDLKFHDASSPLMRINELGVRIRSRLLKMPFGDQGFCISRALFEKVGGFDESAPYGEDHLFVWKCQREHIGLWCVDAAIETSARKYNSNGWLRTTLKHQFLTYKQALPEFLKTYGPFADD